MDHASECSELHGSQPHHVHQSHSIDERMVAAEQLCSAHGVRLTAVRKQVLQLILNAQQPLGAYDLLAMLQQHSERPIAPPTVYRALDFLMQQGLIHRLSSINAYIPCCHPREGHQAVFLICQNCHQVHESSAHDVFSALIDIAQLGGFRPSHSILEMNGLCQTCQLHS